MNILVVGSGGREHALVWKIAQNKAVKNLFCAPGNAGIAQNATCVDIKADDIDGLLSFALSEKIDLTVVGPEAPLAAGIVDIFEKKGLTVFGASKKAAQLEASKTFSKNLMIKYKIPTAQGQSFTNYDQAEKYIKSMAAPLVVKADGLAAGKGVLICNTEKEALNALTLILKDQAFGSAGARVVIEECLIGEEASFLALTDGKTVLALPSSQDHKRIFDNDEGPNTGGMGAYSPAPLVDSIMHDKIMNEVMIPTVNAMAAEGIPYKGILYAGLMIDRDKIKVLEFNARFGDPEAQPLLMRLKSDLVELMLACIDGTLDRHTMDIDDKAAVCLVMAAGGYPNSYAKGKVITGLDVAAKIKDVVVFHAGTQFKGKSVVTSGGRVLGVTALGETVEKAIDKAYKATAKITWDKAFYRKDIGQKALDRLNTPPKVGIVMGSDSDFAVMKETLVTLKKFGIPYEITVASAHRTPERACEFASTARTRGIRVIIAAAGQAAHLAGAMAAHTTLPVIGVPIDASSLNGLDALLSTVQMPPGVPVATVAIGKPGATNAGILAAQILGVSDPQIEKYLEDHKKDMAKSVTKKADALAAKLK
ncbi:MAG: phosphoribosylamine--glycine ligase [Proteobacteria bacterium]|nr:phosphoribosylamine--glycine ligase [Pseudomonadota bacterium]